MKLRLAKKIAKAVGTCPRLRHAYNMMEAALPGWTKWFSGYTWRQIDAAHRRIERHQRRLK